MSQNLLVLKVKAHADNLIDVIVAEQVEDCCFALNVLHIPTLSDDTDSEAANAFGFQLYCWSQCVLRVCMACTAFVQTGYLYEHAECLQHLYGNIPSPICFLLQYMGEVLQNVVFEEKVKELLVVLVAPDRKLSNAT